MRDPRQPGRMDGCVNPSMRSWALLVEYGHARPRSTSGVNVRIEGLRAPPVGLTLHLAGSRAACAQDARGMAGRSVSCGRDEAVAGFLPMG